VRTLTSVVSAGVIDAIPLGNDGSHQPIAIEGRPVVAMSEQPEVDVRLISPGYMSAMRIPVLQGRDFDDTDVTGRPGAVLISQSMARQFWPNEDAIGKHLTLTFSPEISREVVGIVGDVKLDGLDQTRPAVALYVALDQMSVPSLGGWRSFPMTLIVRTATTPGGVASAVTNTVHQLDADMPMRNILTMDDVVATSLSQQRFDTLLLGAFAGLALVLAAIGIYSVLSYSVKRRVGEIGIRMALGARLGDVLRLVIIEGMKPTLLGLAIGVIAALAFGHVMSSLIYQIAPSDPLTFLTVAVLLAAVGFLATVIPAYRASKVDPMVALRDE
jgi:predicted permease